MTEAVRTCSSESARTESLTAVLFYTGSKAMEPWYTARPALWRKNSFHQKESIITIGFVRAELRLIFREVRMSGWSEHEAQKKSALSPA